MIDRDTMDLMHTELDGANTAEESRRLRAYLAEHDQAREYFEDLERLFHRLKHQPEVEPPTHLFHRIVDAIPFGRAPWSGRRKTSTGARSWLRGLAARPHLAYTSAFALGLTIGVSAFLVFDYNTRPDNDVRSFLDISPLSGTMGGAKRTGGYDEVGAFDIDVEAVTGHVWLSRLGSALIADFSLNSERPVEWVLGFDSDKFTVEGFERVSGDAGVFVTESAVSSRQAGDGRYVVRFRGDDDATPIHLELYDSGQLILDKQLTVDLHN